MRGSTLDVGGWGGGIGIVCGIESQILNFGIEYEIGIEKFLNLHSSSFMAKVVFE